MDKEKRNVDTLEELKTIKTYKVGAYPYFPICHTYSNHQCDFLFILDFLDDPMLIIYPYIAQQQLPIFKIVMEDVPKKAINTLRVLHLTYHLNEKTRALDISFIDLVIGFNSGHMVRCSFRNEGKSKRKFSIVSRLNKNYGHKEGLLSKMSKALFDTSEWYKLELMKPMRSFVEIKNHKYKFSYLIGNKLTLCSEISEDMEALYFQGMNEIDWDIVKKGSSANFSHFNLTAVHGKTYRALVGQSAMMIDFDSDIAYYTFSHSNELILADNSINAIIIYDISMGLFEKRRIYFDLDIRKLTYHKVDAQNEYLLVLPYENNLYLLNLSKNKVISLKGHKSYISEARFTSGKAIVTGGLDHRVGIKLFANLSTWASIPPIDKNSQDKKISALSIESQKVEKQKFSQTYFLGQFKNTNSSRNNEYDFGFGNFVRLSQKHQIYAFLSYDFCIKLYKIRA